MRIQPILGSDYRGSLAGITFSKGQWPGVVARMRVAPVNPNTTLQSGVRSAFSGACQKWNDLSDANRALWHDYAQTCDYPGAMGSYKVDGRQMFIACIQPAIYLEQQGVAIGDSDPTPPALPGFLNVTNVQPIDPVGVGVTGIGLSFESTGTEGIVGYAVRSFAFNPARNTFKGPFQSETLASAVIASPASGVMEWDGLEEDMIYFTKFRAITEDAPHRISAAFYCRHVGYDVPI